MPATQQGQYDKVNGKYRVRWYERNGKRHAKSGFASKSAARAHFRDHIEPVLLGKLAAVPALTLAEFVPVYLERHAVNVRPRTISTLRDRLRHALAAFGDIPLRELERMTNEIAGWQAQLPPRAGHGIAQAFRQVLDAAVRWGYIAQNPAKLAGKNRKPAPRAVRPYSREELDAIAAELTPMYAPLVDFAAATGLRPEEWQALERKDIDKAAGALSVRRTVSSREVVELGKTARSRRQVPLTRRALDALDDIPPRLDSSLVFPSPEGNLLHLDNFRHREWEPAIAASGVAKPARIYDLRSTFASNAIAAGVAVFELAKIMGTSIEMIERHYGALLDGSGASIAGRLDAFDAAQAPAAAARQQRSD